MSLLMALVFVSELGERISAYRKGAGSMGDMKIHE